ncbi:MAG: argininosuccinate lyase [Inquilinaceae bacterium]
MATGKPGGFPAPVYKETVLAPLFDLTKRRFAAEMMAINYAHAVMLGEQNLLTPDEAGAILAALRRIEAETRPEDLTYTGQFEDYFFFVEDALAARLGPDLAGKLHTGRSRNDMDHTMFKMRLRDELAGLRRALIGLTESLIGVAEAQGETLVVAYTHGQPAQPTTYGHYLAALIEVLLRDQDRLAQAAAIVDRCSMGAAAITTTGFAIDRARMADLLGFADIQENSYGCIAACDYITGAYAALKVLFLNIGRFVQDLNQWTGFETGHLHVPDAFVQISSIMPQKRNPVPVEHLRLIASLGAGHCDTMMTVMHNTPFTDMNDSEGEVQAAGYRAFDAGHRLIALLRGVMEAATIDGDRVRRHIAESCITLTELADSLVRAEGLSFRQAHGVAARLARRAIDAGGTAETIAFTDFHIAFTDAAGRPPAVTETDFRRFLTPEHFIAVRERAGGPGPAALAASLGRYSNQAAAARAALEAEQARRDKARAALTDAADRRMVAGTVVPSLTDNDP